MLRLSRQDRGHRYSRALRTEPRACARIARLHAHGKITRYAIGSVVALATSIVVFAFLYVAGVDTTIDSIAAFIAGAIPNWVLNRKWAWEMTDRVEVAREVVGYTSSRWSRWAASSSGTGLMQTLVRAITSRQDTASGSCS